MASARSGHLRHERSDRRAARRSMTLIIGDTSAQYLLAIPTTPTVGTVGPAPPRCSATWPARRLARRRHARPRRWMLLVGLVGGGQVAARFTDPLARSRHRPVRRQPDRRTFGAAARSALRRQHCGGGRTANPGATAPARRRRARRSRGRPEQRFGSPAPARAPPHGAGDVRPEWRERTPIGPRRGLRWFLAGYAGVSRLPRTRGDRSASPVRLDLHAIEGGRRPHAGHHRYVRRLALLTRRSCGACRSSLPAL